MRLSRLSICELCGQAEWTVGGQGTGMEWGVAEQHCQVKDTRRGDNRKLRIADNQWEDREDREKRLGKVSMQQRRCLC